MDFHQLEIFLSIAKHKSFSKAADAVFLTQPTLSTHISSLENELGIMLFNRGGKEVTLTPSGEVFFTYALELINLRATGLANLSLYMNKIEGSLEIGVSKTPIIRIVPQMITEFLDKYPNVSILLHETTSAGIAQRILDSEIELGVVEAKHDSPKIEYTLLESDHFVVVVPDSVKFSGWNSTVEMKELKNERLLMMGKKTEAGKALEKAMGQKAINLADYNIVVESDSCESLIQMVVNGLGIAILPEKAVTGLENNQCPLKVLQIKNISAITRGFYLAYHKKRTLSPLANCFKEYIERENLSY